VSNEIRLTYTSGTTDVKAEVVSAAGTVWNGSALVEYSALADNAAWLAGLLACTELTLTDSTKTGIFAADLPGTLPSGIYTIRFFQNPAAPTERPIAVQEDPEEYIAGQVGDIYHADIELTIDSANSMDEYTVRWFKNGTRLTTGVTNPTIQVIDRFDGSDLIAETAMSDPDGGMLFVYDEDTDRTVLGQSYDALAGATIDGVVRYWSKLVSRDDPE